MNTKVLEVRDKNESVVVLATRMGSICEREAMLLQKAGFSAYTVLLYHTQDKLSTTDPLRWLRGDFGLNERYVYLHRHLEKNWDSVTSGDVISLQDILEQENYEGG